MESADRDSANDDPLCLDLRKVFRPCPLCRAGIEVWEQLGPQEVNCGSCGLSCTIDASPPSVALAASLLEPMVDVSPVVEHWLEHAPKPVRPELTPEALKARKRRLIAAAAGLVGVLILAVVAGHMGYLQANEHFDRRLAEQWALAEENELHLLSVKHRLERERLDAQQRQSAAEREARLMTARFLAARAHDVGSLLPWRAVSTAVDAVNATLLQDGYAVAEAHQALRDALAQTPAAYRIDGTVLSGHHDAILALAVSRDGRWLATGSADQSVRLWDLQADGSPGASISLKRHNAAVTHVLFSHDSRWLITGSVNSSACIWDLTSDAANRGPVVLPGRDGPITKMSISPNGRWLAIVFASAEGGDVTARLWDLTAGPQQARSLELNGQSGPIEAVAISPDSRWLAIGVADTVHLWDLAAHAPAVASVGRQCLQGGITAALFTQDGKWLVTSGHDGSARLWSLSAADPSKSLQLRGHKSAIKLLAASADSRWLATAAGTSLKLWDLSAQNPNASAVELPVAAHAAAAAFSGDGHWLAAAASDGSMLLWSIGDEGPSAGVVRLPAKTSGGKIAFTPDNQWLATAGANGAVRLWNVNLHDLLNRAASAMLGRKHSVAYRYLWLDPTQTSIGKVSVREIAATNAVLAWHSLQSQRIKAQAAAVSLVTNLSSRWREIRPQVAQRMAARTAAAVGPTTPRESPAAPERSASEKVRYVIPRHATQGNTLRLYVR